MFLLADAAQNSVKSDDIVAADGSIGRIPVGHQGRVELRLQACAALPASVWSASAEPLPAVCHSCRWLACWSWHISQRVQASLAPYNRRAAASRRRTAATGARRSAAPPLCCAPCCKANCAKSPASGRPVDRTFFFVEHGLNVVRFHLAQREVVSIRFVLPWPLPFPIASQGLPNIAARDLRTVSTGC